MRDKGLDIFLMVLLGIGGITILVLVWAQPMPLPERILTISMGSIGPIWVLTRAPSLISMLGKIGLRKHMPEVEFQKKPH